MQSAVYCADFSDMSEFLSPCLNHSRVKHRIPGLENRLPVATVNLSAAVHHENWNNDVPGILHQFGLSSVDGADPTVSHRGRIYHLPVCIVFPFSVKFFQKTIGITVAVSLLDL